MFYEQNHRDLTPLATISLLCIYLTAVVNISQNNRHLKHMIDL